MRLTYALLLSLLIHTLLLNLTFSGLGWIPGVGFSRQVQTFPVPDVRVVLVPPDAATKGKATAVAQPPQQVLADLAIRDAPPPTPSVSSSPLPGPFATAIVPRARVSASAKERTQAKRQRDVKPTTEPKSSIGKSSANATPPSDAEALPRADGQDDATLPSVPPPDVIALERSDEPTWEVPTTPATPMPDTGIAPNLSSPKNTTPAVEDTGDTAEARADQEALEKADEATKRGPSAEEVQRQREEQEGQRQEASRQDAVRAETARLEAEREEAARQAAAQQEAQRQEAGRQDAARAETARLDAERQDAARQAAAQQEAERQEAARQAAAQQEAQRREAARLDAEKREERLRAIGRQLDEEAAQREAASNAARLPNTLPLSLSTARRVRLWGRTHSNMELLQYAEAWAQKIQLNTALETVREIAKWPHTPPMVTVAIRSDGSVESITIDRSSGVTQIDEAIRRVVESHKPYQAFPPSLSRDFDVVEIRRTWHVDFAIRLY